MISIPMPVLPRLSASVPLEAIRHASAIPGLSKVAAFSKDRGSNPSWAHVGAPHASLYGSDKTGFLFAPPPFSPTFGLKLGRRSLEYKIGSASPVVMRFGSLEEATAFTARLAQMTPAGGKLANGTVGIQIAGRFRPLTEAESGHLVVAPSNGEAMGQAASVDPAQCAIGS